jgi:endonuclease/exonuclease/phosphatase family metal-dependent hydrolase
MDCVVRFVTIVKKVVFCIAPFLLSATLSGAALLLNDTFSYPDGPLVTAAGSPWTTYSGTITGQVKVVSGRFFLSKANSEDVHATLLGQPYASTSGAILYVSFKINYTNLPSSAGSYFAEFKDDSLGFRAKIFAQTAGAATGAFRIGIANAGSLPSAVFNADLQTNTDYTIVARLAVSNVVSTLWLNPTAETNAGVTATDAASALTITSFGFREDGSSGTIGNFFVDDLRVGTTFPDVVTNAPPLERPAIVSQPQNQTVTNGANVTFSVNATGTPPLAYQWQLNNTNLPGATSSNLTLTAVTFGQAGFYTVVITNVLGSAGSDPVALSVWCASAPSFSFLTYNANGNGQTNWSTNMWHVRAIGRQVQYLNPDIITFQEIPVTNNCTAQMADFVAAFRPGYYLVTNSAADGYIRSAILSRFPIVASKSWLHGVYLGPYGYTNASPSPYFSRDLFEAQIAVPGFPQPLHVFTVHLKSGQAGPESSKRAAEAGAVSNFFATIYLPTNGQQPYVLSGDMNEDILRPPDSNPQSIQRLVSTPTGLQLATAVNPFTDSELTISIRDGLTKRYDYILPCAMLFSNIVGSQVFRTDLLNPLPPNLYSDDENASDHLPVFMVFANPFNTPFRLLSIGRTNQIVSLKWESTSNRQYHVEVSSNLTAWMPLVTNLAATGADFTFSTNVPGDVKFFRIRRAP